jgi:hypothetical protein
MLIMRSVIRTAPRMTLVQVAVAALTVALAQTTSIGKQPPRFEDYPVGEVFTGAPAPPRFVNGHERRYRTAITNGVTKGYGVLEDPKEGKAGAKFRRSLHSCSVGVRN